MYICISESGNETQDGFVVLGGFITKDIYQVRSTYKKSEKAIKQTKGIDLKTALKVTTFNQDDKKLVLNSLLKTPSMMPFCFYYKISSHKNQTKTRTNQFNFDLINSIVETLLMRTYHEKEYWYINTDEEIVLELSNTIFKPKLKEKLKNYLEKKNQAFEIDRDLKQIICATPKNSFDMQIAHLFSNYFWTDLNHPNTNSYLEKELDSTIYHAQIVDYSEYFSSDRQLNYSPTNTNSATITTERSPATKSSTGIIFLIIIFQIIRIIFYAFFRTLFFFSFLWLFFDRD